MRKISLMLAFSLALFGCGLNLKSQWKKAEITVDGRDGEWWNVPGADQSGFSLRAINDGSTLYLCLSSASRDVKSTLAGSFRQPLTLWFDSDNHHQKISGLKLSLIPDLSIGYPKSGNAESDYVGSALHILSLEAPGQEGFPKILTDTASSPVEAAISTDRGKMILELKIPLPRESRPGQAISLGLEIPAADPNAVNDEQRHESEARESPRREGGEGGGSGMGGRHGRKHGGGGGGLQGQGRAALADPVNFMIWGTLYLAAPPQGSGS